MPYRPVRRRPTPTCPFLFDWGSVLNLTRGHRLSPSFVGVALGTTIVDGSLGREEKKRKRGKANLLALHTPVHVRGADSLPSLMTREQFLLAMHQSASEPWALFVRSACGRQAIGSESERAGVACPREPCSLSMLPGARVRNIRTLPGKILAPTIFAPHFWDVQEVGAGRGSNARHTRHARRFEVFADLWQRGFRVTSAFKFGGDFLAYAKDPMFCHAQLLVTVVTADAALAPWRLIRVCARSILARTRFFLIVTSFSCHRLELWAM